MNWIEVKDSEGSAVLETSDGTYEILLNQRLETDEPDGYLLYCRDRMALLNSNKEVVIGLGMFNAHGAPPECVFKNIDEIKLLIERVT